MKVCFKCNQAKDLSEFYKHEQMADGHLNKCKECTKEDVAKNYRTNINHFVAYEKERELRPERKESKFLHMRNHRHLNPEKYKARTAVGNALRDGRIVKKNCERCGSVDSQAHHHDYSRPLDVKWMCFACHRAEHGQEARTSSYVPPIREVRQHSLF